MLPLLLPNKEPGDPRESGSDPDKQRETREFANGRNLRIELELKICCQMVQYLQEGDTEDLDQGRVEREG